MKTFKGFLKPLTSGEAAKASESGLQMLGLGRQSNAEVAFRASKPGGGPRFPSRRGNEAPLGDGKVPRIGAAGLLSPRIGAAGLNLLASPEGRNVPGGLHGFMSTENGPDASCCGAVIEGPPGEFSGGGGA
mmetsp:Transcript_47849/g.86294  ORF Transcript_47849/g.86294 Transcript_47849/m.86294 type:complete len:131 (+) Transcript_47849:247-639(+)